MGITKAFLEKQETGFYSQCNKFVCYRCVGDKVLKKFIRQDAVTNKCDYCNHFSDKAILTAAPLENLIEVILDGIKSEWADPVNELPYISAEGGWQGAEVYDTYDLMGYLQDHTDITSESLLHDIVDALSEKQWCIPPDQIDGNVTLRSSWNSFVHLITYKYRYTFFEVNENLYYDEKNEEHGSISPKKILAALAYIFTECKTLIKTIPKNTKIIRARVFENKSAITYNAQELGTAPERTGTANRMSPAGIPLFYGALDDDTALNETINNTTDANSQFAIVATFTTLKELYILNLCTIPEIPSIFDQKKRHLREPIEFIKSFSKEISRHIPRDGHEHIDYVPTQAMTEYFRHIFMFKKNKRLDGIFYPSSKNENGVCCALFVENEECVDSRSTSSDKGTLQLLSHHRKNVI